MPFALTSTGALGGLLLTLLELELPWNRTSTCLEVGLEGG